MNPLTELEEKLASQEGAALQQEIAHRLQALAARLQSLKTDRLQPREDFARLILLESATEAAQKVMQEAGGHPARSGESPGT